MKDLVALETLRSDLKRFYEWSNDWIMLLILINVKYCTLLLTMLKVNIILGDQVLESVWNEI